MRSSLKTALRGLRDSASQIGKSEIEAIEEKSKELSLRHVFRLFPGGNVKDDQVPKYLEEVLGGPVPDTYELLVRPNKRGVRLDPGEYEALESAQNLRCAVCGAPLVRSAKPHIDHKIPVSLGGSNDIENLQILCERCNLGKSNALHWLMLNPYFAEEINKVSARLSYCVFSRDASRCTVPECEEHSRTCSLFAVPRVPIQRGGRLIFDNLTTVCEFHKDEINRDLYQSARQRVNAVRMGLSL
jgi:hypothetical protein